MAKVREPNPRARAGDNLDTPTDLSPEGTGAIAAALNGVLADSFALYVKTKNFHWHVSGPNFRDYHQLFDEQAAQILATTDPLDERVRKISRTTLRSIGHIAQLTNVADNDAPFVSPLEMLNELVADNKAVVRSMREAHHVCDEHNDVASASLLENFIDEAEERVWFLFEASRGLDASGH
jgi:starvation-inducible DNA-binding protein